MERSRLRPGHRPALRQVDGVTGKALCLDYDFNGVSGYAVARRKLPMDYPANYEYALELRGEAPANNLEFKLGDASRRERLVGDAPELRAAVRMDADQAQAAADFLRLGTDGRQDAAAQREIRDHRQRRQGRRPRRGLFRRAELSRIAQGRRRAAAADGDASAAMPGGEASRAVDGDPASAWRAPAGAQSADARPGPRARIRRTHAALECATSSPRAIASSCRTMAMTGAHVRTVRDGNGGDDPIALPESEARWIRLSFDGGRATNYGLAEITVEDLAFAATPNDFLKAVARQAPRGRFPARIFRRAAVLDDRRHRRRQRAGPASARTEPSRSPRAASASSHSCSATASW